MDESKEAEQPQSQNDPKKERIDELDIIGGGLLKIVTNIGNRIKGLFVPRKGE